MKFYLSFNCLRNHFICPPPPTPLAWSWLRIRSFSASRQTHLPLGRVPDSAINKNTNPVSLYLLPIKVCCSVTKSCLTLCNPMDCSTPGFPVLHHLPELLKLMFIESGMPSRPLLPSSPPALNLFQHQGLFQWVSSLHQVARVLEL